MMQITLLLLLLLLGTVSCADTEEFGHVLLEDEAFWGRSLLRGASSMMSVGSMAPSSSDCQVLYGAARKYIPQDGSIGPVYSLVTINVATETEERLGILENNFLLDGDSTEGFEFDVGSETIWTGDRLDDMSFSNTTLSQIDPVTAATVGSVGEYTGRFSALQFVNGVLYGIYDIYTLVTVDTDTGALTTIGRTRAVADLAYDESTNTLWGLGSGFRDFSLLFTIDVETGSVGGITLVSIPYVRSIEFCPDSCLYAGSTTLPGCGLRPYQESCGRTFYRVGDIYAGIGSPQPVSAEALFAPEHGDFLGLTCGTLLPSSTG